MLMLNINDIQYTQSQRHLFRYTATAIFLVMAISDAVDGYLARHKKQVTKLGAFLDPLADKLLVVFAIVGLDKLKIDDPVGAISVHGVVGLLGLLLVPVTNDGTSYLGQLVGAATIFVWVFGASLLTWFLIKLVMGIRVSEEEEYEGLDIGECGLEAYPEFTSARP